MKIAFYFSNKKNRRSDSENLTGMARTDYGGLKLVPLGLKRLVLLQSVNKVKLNLSLCSCLAYLTLVKHDAKFNSTL